MTVHEKWRAEYKLRRYLEHFTLDKLERRARDIIANHTFLTERGRIGVLPPTTEGLYWMRLFTHLLEELAIRRISFSNGFMKDASLPKPSWPEPPKATIALRDRNINLEKCLFKFGKSRHLKPMLDEGKLRIAQASYYSDPSLNAAIGDDELRFNFELHPQRVRLEILDPKTLKPKGKISPLGNISVTQPVSTDYWLFCMAKSYPNRAYDDFEADACLVIKDSDRFIKLLLASMESTGETLDGMFGAVDYRDPINTPPHSTRPFFTKHFRYAYQKELRVVWLPPVPQKALKPIDLTLGSLKDIAELLVLN